LYLAAWFVGNETGHARFSNLHFSKTAVLPLLLTAPKFLRSVRNSVRHITPNQVREWDPVSLSNFGANKKH
jgi:hypothetical protein